MDLKAGFIGLRTIGPPVYRNLAESGFDCRAAKSSRRRPCATFRGPSALLERTAEQVNLPARPGQLHRLRSTDDGGILACSVLATLPAVAVYLLVQRQLVAGLTAGSIKG